MTVLLALGFLSVGFGGACFQPAFLDTEFLEQYVPFLAGFLTTFQLRAIQQWAFAIANNVVKKPEARNDAKKPTPISQQSVINQQCCQEAYFKIVGFLAEDILEWASWQHISFMLFNSGLLSCKLFWSGLHDNSISSRISVSGFWGEHVSSQPSQILDFQSSMFPLLAGFRTTFQLHSIFQWAFATAKNVVKTPEAGMIPRSPLQ